MKMRPHTPRLQYFKKSIKSLSRMVNTGPYLSVHPHYWSEEERVYLSSIYHHSRRSSNSVEGYSDSSIAELMNSWAEGEVDLYTRFKVKDEMLKPEFQRLLNQRIELAKVSPHGHRNN
jgi:hypothetical protein